MKKIFLLLSIITLLPQSGESQILIGPSVGPSVSSYFAIRITAKNKTTTMTGMRAGAYFYAKLSRKFGIQAMPAYLENGGGIINRVNWSGYSSNNPKTNYGYFFKIRSIDVPLGIVFSLHARNENKLVVGLCPYIRYNINGTASYYQVDQSYTHYPAEEVIFEKVAVIT